MLSQPWVEKQTPKTADMTKWTEQWLPQVWTSVYCDENIQNPEK